MEPMARATATEIAAAAALLSSIRRDCSPFQ